MKKGIKYFVFGFLMLFGFVLNVNAESLPAAVDGTITLDKDYTIDAITFDTSSDVDVLDLNGNTLTLNDTLKISKAFEIKNGNILRSSIQISDSMIEISSEANESVIMKDLVIDGIKGVKTITDKPYNYTYAGFGIYINNNSTVVLDGVTLKDHYTGNSLGAGALKIVNANSVIVRNSEFFGNLAYGGKSANGAAIHAEGAKHLELINTKIYNNRSQVTASVIIKKTENFIMDKDCIVKDNEAWQVAGLHIADSNATISGTFEGNKSTGDNGGGLYTMFNIDAPNMVIRITKDAKFINNEAAFAGGGLYVNSNKPNMPGKVIIEGATFSGNKALGTVDASDGLYKDIGGGAIAVARGILEINDIKLSNNIASVGLGNSIIVSHANGNLNGGKLTINGGSFDNSIDLGVGSIVVNGGTFKQDMSKYITNNKLVSKKTSDGYEVVENVTLKDENVTFDNDSAMDNGYELVVTDKTDLLKDKDIENDIKSMVTKEDKSAKDIKVLGLYDISVSDGTKEVEMKNGNYRITINLDEKLLKYNSYAGVYIDDEGNVSYIPVKIDGNKVTFETSHLSTYGVVGYNILNPATNTNVGIIISFIFLVLMVVCVKISMKKQENNA